MQAQAAEFSGCAGQFRCFLERRAQFVLIQFILKQASLKTARSAERDFYLKSSRALAPWGALKETCNSRSQKLQEFRSCRMGRRLSALRM